MEKHEDQTSIQVRLAAAEDIKAIASVLRESFAEFEDQYTPAAFTATTPDSGLILGRLDEGPVWIAALDGVIVGTVSVVSRNDELYVRSMAVLPTARGHGLGFMLLQEVENYAVETGVQSLVLSTTPFLDSAIQLYERFGFQRSESGPPDLYGTPLFTMIKPLK